MMSPFVPQTSPDSDACDVASPKRRPTVSIAGIALFLLGAAAAAAGLYAKGTIEHEIFPLQPPEFFIGLAGIPLLLASGIVFLVAAVRNRVRPTWNCALCNLALFTLIVWLLVGDKVAGYLNRRGEERKTNVTFAELNKLGREIEAIHARLGRLPRDEEELVALRRNPMPEYFIYAPRGDDRFLLICSLPRFWGRGAPVWWEVVYFGPGSQRKIMISTSCI